MDTRRAAIVGGNRIPFARSNGAYAQASNQDMLTATLDGLVARFGLQDVRLGEVAAGAVLKHSRDFNLTREAVLGSRLGPETPAYDVQQACGTGLETVILTANKIALGQIDSAVAGRRRHHLRRPDRGERGPAQRPARGQPGEVAGCPAQGAGEAAPDPARAGHPAELRAAHRAVDGRAPGRHHLRVGHHPRGAGRAGGGLAPQPGRRLRPWLPRRPHHAVPRPVPRPEPARRLHRWRSWPSCRRCSARSTATRPR